MDEKIKTLIFNISHAGFEGYNIHTPVINETTKSYIVVNHRGFLVKVNKKTLKENLGNCSCHLWQKGRGF